ncbi:hypothetical protein T06_16425 [Trichinella sp. T6]|nr:hypothetical protein T06_16425 [Trichinella sp. T6]
MCEGGLLASSEDDHDGRFEIKQEPAPNERLGIGCALVTPNSWDAEAVKIERDLLLTFRSVETCGDADELARTRRQIRRPHLGFSVHKVSPVSQSTNPHVPLVSTVRIMRAICISNYYLICIY